MERPSGSDAADARFVELFEECAWPLEKWHHRDHVKLAYLYLLRHPREEAGRRLRDGIRAHNATHGVPDAIDSGYHETLTQAWLRLVEVTLREYGPASNADEFYEAHPELSQKKTLRLFYSRDRMMSREAKESFVEPDLTPLPQSRRRTGDSADRS